MYKYVETWAATRNILQARSFWWKVLICSKESKFNVEIGFCWIRLRKGYALYVAAFPFQVNDKEAGIPFWVFLIFKKDLSQIFIIYICMSSSGYKQTRQTHACSPKIVSNAFNKTIFNRVCWRLKLSFCVFVYYICDDAVTSNGNSSRALMTFAMKCFKVFFECSSL